MYLCQVRPLKASKHTRILSRAHDFIKRWRAESPGSRPYVRVKCPGLNGKVFIDDFHYHIEAKGGRNMTGRYRLLPCVKELLKKTMDTPVLTKQGNLMLEGITPEGSKFRVIIRPEKKGGCLQSFYPV